jgi:hypothetical protein
MPSIVGSWWWLWCNLHYATTIHIIIISMKKRDKKEEREGNKM